MDYKLFSYKQERSKDSWCICFLVLAVYRRAIHCYWSPTFPVRMHASQSDQQKLGSLLTTARSLQKLSRVYFFLHNIRIVTSR